MQGAEGSSEKNETLRQAQGDKRKGFEDSSEIAEERKSEVQKLKEQERAFSIYHHCI
jgi:hypothetical protein